MKEDQADWTAWVLQFCLGALAGAVVTYAPCWWFGILIGQWAYLFGVVAGGALLVGGAAAYHGDRFWLGRSAYLDERSRGRRSARSREVAFLVAIAGGTVMAGVLIGYWLRQAGGD